MPLLWAGYAFEGDCSRPILDLGSENAHRCARSNRRYWQKAFFTYWFFDVTAGDDAAHCYADRSEGVPAYTDLQVGQSRRILRLWTGEPDDIADSYPNVRVADSLAVIELFKGSARAKLIGLLAAGKIASWARVSSGKSRDLIKLDGGCGAPTLLHSCRRTATTGSIKPSCRLKATPATTTSA